MNRTSKVRKGNKKAGKALNRTLNHRRGKLEKKPQMTLSEFFRTSPLVGLDFSRDKSPIYRDPKGFLD
jgi:hypothetical protein